MSIAKSILATLTLAGLLSVTGNTLAAESGNAGKQAAKPKAYPLTTCAVSGEKLGGDMGEPYIFTHEGREIKLCCKSCLKDFKKEPAKYVKKLEQAEKGKKS
jgi:YHS domain-containing protein